VADFLGGALEATLRFADEVVFFAGIVTSPFWWMLLPAAVVAGISWEIQSNPAH